MTTPAGLGRIVARSADSAELHAPVPTLLLELQTLLGTLAATVARDTDRGRRPFRPDAAWSDRLGEFAYGMYLLADQTNVDVDAAVSLTASRIAAAPQQAAPPATDDWPVPNA